MGQEVALQRPASHLFKVVKRQVHHIQDIARCINFVQTGGSATGLAKSTPRPTHPSPVCNWMHSPKQHPTRIGIWGVSDKAGDVWLWRRQAFNESKSILKGGVRTLEQEHMAFRSEGTVKAALLARHRLGQVFVLAQQYGDPVPGQPGGF